MSEELPSWELGEAAYSSGYKSGAAEMTAAAAEEKAMEKVIDAGVAEGAKAGKADRAGALNAKMQPVLDACKDGDAVAHKNCDGKLAAARATFKAHANKYAAAKERKQKQQKAEAEATKAASYTSGEKKDIDSAQKYASAAGDAQLDL